MAAWGSGHYHWCLKKISRSRGHSATAACAYRTGTVVTDDRTGARHDYTRRDGVMEHLILLPQTGHPASFMKSSVLWNGQEKSEKRKDSCVGREIDIGLPHQLSPEGRRKIGIRMAQAIVDRYCVGAEISFHAPSNKKGHDRRNWHVHIMFTSREIGPEGFGTKTLILDNLKTGPEEVKILRQTWQDIANEELEREGSAVRIDCRSLKDQGITDRLPQIHKGPKVQAMIDRGVEMQSIVKLRRRKTKKQENNVIDYPAIDRGRSRVAFNGEIIALNAHRAAQGPLPLDVQIRNLERMIEVLLEKVTDLEAVIPRSLLPEWVRRKVERAWRRAVEIAERQFLSKKEAEKRQKARREGIHARMERMRDELRRLEKEKHHKQALQHLYIRITAHAAMHPSPKASAAQTKTKPARVMSNRQFSVELKFKAETTRTKVPPRYRPRIERPAHEVIWDHEENQSLSREFRKSKPADNGGLAALPPPLAQTFNEAAQPPARKSYKTKIEIGFGPA